MSDKTYVFDSGASNLNSMLPALLQQRGIDPAYLMGLIGNNRGNGFFGGNGGFQDIIALIVIAAIFGNGNGNGIFGGGGNNANSAEREMIMQTLNRNGVDIGQLAQAVNCSTGQITAAISQVAGDICKLGNQMGQSTNQIITAIMQGNNALTAQIASCCCDLKQIMAQGFSSIGYETQKQTCDIEKAIASSTEQILAGQRAAEMREMQDKIDALREKNSQQAVILNNAQQTSQFAAMLAPIQADLAELKCNQVPVKKIACPETYVPVNRSINENYGLIPSCGFGAFGGLGYGNWGNCNNVFAWG